MTAGTYAVRKAIHTVLTGHFLLHDRRRTWRTCRNGLLCRWGGNDRGFPSVPLTNFTVQKLPNYLQTRECERTRRFASSLRKRPHNTRQWTHSSHRHHFATCSVLPHFASRLLQAYIIFAVFCLQGCNSTVHLLKFGGIFRCSMEAA